MNKKYYSIFLSFLIAIPMAGSLPSTVSADTQAVYFFVGDDYRGHYPVLSNGDGTFGPVTKTFLMGDDNRGGAVGDFDEDGDLDFVGCDEYANDCYLYTQNNGVFLNAGYLNVGTSLNGYEMGMTAADFNGDGHLDVAFSGFQPFFRTIVGDGNGGFSIDQTILTSNNGGPHGMDAADINGDGYIDLVIGFFPGGEVAIFLNDGTGNFPTSYIAFDTLGSSNQPFAVTAGDFDGDTLVDIIAGGSADGIVSLWKGDGSGGFTYVADIFDFDGNTGMDSYDFDGDGDLDLVSVTKTSRRVQYFAGNGDGTFAAPVILAVISRPGIGIAAPMPLPPCTDNDGDGFAVEGGSCGDIDCDDMNAAISPGAAEACNGVDDDCDELVDEGFDADADGYTSCGGDCNDDDPLVNPAAAEECNGVDDNCNGITDEGYDADNDGITVCGGDCNDEDPVVYPGATETCNFIDDNCDGAVDEGFDADGDGYVICANDCNESDPNINPGAEEICDAVDNNCNEEIDEGFDEDGDGYTTCGGDCNDAEVAVNPGVAEECNGVDDNCDGTVDEGFDEDGDGYTTCGGDSDDTNPNVNPGMDELCNGIDDDSDGEIDEGYDADGDGVTSCGGDCNDSDATILPGAMEECNGVDDNCDGTVDEGFDEDGDGYTTCGGDCNDSVQRGVDASITIDITNASSEGPGADMSDEVYVGNDPTPIGNGVVTIPLTQNGVAIIDSTSNPDVPGLHLQRGVENGTPFVRINAYGHNAQTTREIVKGSLALNGAVVSWVNNGPDGPYEKKNDGICNDSPGNDEYEISVGASAGTFCSITNVHSDNVTIGYVLTSPVFCNHVTSPVTQCTDSQYASCGICINPGMNDPFADGIDNDCDGEPDCGMKTDYETDSCKGSVKVRSDAELDAYLENFGYADGRYKDLRILYDINRPLVDIHSPCRIFIKKKKTITGDTICIDGRKGVRANPKVTLEADRIGLFSEKGTVWITTKTSVRAVMELAIKAWKKVVIGSKSTIMGQSTAQLEANGIHGKVIVNAKASVNTKTLNMTAGKRVRVGPKANITVAEDLFMDAPQCFIHHKADIDATTTAGRCFTQQYVPDDGEEGDDELNDPED